MLVRAQFEPNELPAEAERASAMALVSKLSSDPNAFAEKRVKRGRKSTEEAAGKKGDSVVNVRKAIKGVTSGKGGLRAGAPTAKGKKTQK